MSLVSRFLYQTEPCVAIINDTILHLNKCPCSKNGLHTEFPQSSQAESTCYWNFHKFQRICSLDLMFSVVQSFFSKSLRSLNTPVFWISIKLEHSLTGLLGISLVFKYFNINLWFFFWYHLLIWKFQLKQNLSILHQYYPFPECPAKMKF